MKPKTPKSRAQAEFEARGEAAWQEYCRTGTAYSARRVIDELIELLEAKRAWLKSKSISQR